MPEDNKDDFAEKIRQFQRDLADAKLSSEALSAAIDLATSICFILKTSAPETKKELLNKNYEWPTLLNVNDLKKSWIRLERCPEEIKLIKEELGTEPKPFFSPSESFYTLEKDDLGKIIELIAKYFKTFLLPVSLLEKNKKKIPSFIQGQYVGEHTVQGENPKGHPFFLLDVISNQGKCEFVALYLPEFKRGDDHIKYIWAKEIFHYAFKISKPPLTTGDLVAGSEKFHAAYYLSECEQTYLEKGGVILDIPWESKYHERSPYLYSVFYRHRKWNLTRDNLLNLTADDKVTDGWLRGKIIEAIKYQLDDTMERLDGMMS